MKHLPILALLFVLALSVKASDTTSSVSPSISLPIYAKCITLVQLKIKGKPAWFIFDSGASGTFLLKTAEDKYDFIDAPYMDTELDANGIGGSTRIFKALAATIQIGSITIEKGIQVLDQDFSTLSNLAGHPISGIIGTDNMKKYHLVLDFSTNTIHN